VKTWGQQYVCNYVKKKRSGGCWKKNFIKKNDKVRGSRHQDDHTMEEKKKKKKKTHNTQPKKKKKKERTGCPEPLMAGDLNWGFHRSTGVKKKAIRSVWAELKKKGVSEGDCIQKVYMS